MDVSVKLHGHLHAGAGPSPGPLLLTLPDDATAGDLLRSLAERVGGIFSSLKETGPKLPTRVRLFVDGEMAVHRDRPLASDGTSSPRVSVVILAPITGGGPGGTRRG